MRKLILREEQDLVQGPEQGHQSFLYQLVLPSWAAPEIELHKLDKSNRGETIKIKAQPMRVGVEENDRRKEAKIHSRADKGKSFPVDLSKNKMFHRGGREPLVISV